MSQPRITATGAPGAGAQARPAAGHTRAVADAACPGAGDPALEQAVERLRHGEDPEAGFRVIFDRLHAPLLRFFGRKGFSPEDCLDLTQETFVGIYKGVHGFRHEARFETWVYTVARTTYLKRLRRNATAKRAAVEVSLEAGAEAMAGPETAAAPLERLELDEQQRAMREAILELPERMRRCLMLRVYQDLSYRDIAAVMRLKIDTVKAHLFQARQRLQERLGSSPAFAGGGEQARGGPAPSPGAGR
jgi:RNA polymerase sigma-70 factor (ECF subfamily)